jgi:hypothetical protein
VRQWGIHLCRLTAGQVGVAVPMSAAPWTVVFAVEALIRLVLITEYLTQAYSGFGEPLVEAQSHVQQRIEAIITAA